MTVRRLAPLPVALSAALLVALALVGCSGSSHPSAAVTTTTPAGLTPTTTIAGGGSTAAPSTSIAIQANGPRTVLSPIGLNIRSAPSKTASVAGTVGQGAVVTVISHTDQGGGWYQVMGATLTGYITDNPNLSAAGKFSVYDTNQQNFTALYPESWDTTEAPPNSVVFHPKTGPDTVVVTTAAKATDVPRGRSGYHQVTHKVLVVCGVTGDLVTLAQSGATASSIPGASPGASLPASVTPQRYLLQMRLTLDATHLLAVDANLADLADQPVVENIVESISFPFPQCEGGAAAPGGSTTVPRTTVP